MSLVRSSTWVRTGRSSARSMVAGARAALRVSLSQGFDAGARTSTSARAAAAEELSRLGRWRSSSRPRERGTQTSVELAKGLEPSTTCFPAGLLGWILLGLGFPVFPTVFACMRGGVSAWIRRSGDESGGLSGGLARSSRRPCSGAEEPAGVAGSRVDGVHHAVTRSALDAVRRLSLIHI